MNNIFINNNDIDGLHFGSSSVSKVYFGSNLVYEDTPTPIPNYLQFTAVNGATTIELNRVNMSPNVSYSFDGTNWTTWDYSNLTIPNGETIYFKGNNPNGFTTGTTTATSVVNYSKFAMTGTVESHGNIMSLLYEDNFEGEYLLPSDWCFAALFSGCTSLTTSPELPATGITFNCYRNMFAYCTSLTTAPQLPATTLANYCYNNMFYQCTSLTTAPTTLPATSLQRSCYQGMFFQCPSLTTAPTLPATTLAQGCYSQMFNGCTSLNYIKAMFTTTPSSSYTSNWVNGVAASGTFVKNSAATWTTTGYNGVPTGWTIQTASS